MKQPDKPLGDLASPVSTYSPQTAYAARMTREELFAEVNRRIAAGTLVLPEAPEERKRALAREVLVILGERYNEKMPQA